ncbi:MAG TPA: hypothetical protein VHP81_11295, partial [Lachnospiraceae bacterium]|nr:hypothetical protein [Lachnospiraceae bacterium]
MEFMKGLIIMMDCLKEKYVILENWNLNDVYIEKIGNGISSDACLIVSKEGKFILRKLQTESQALQEYKIAKALEGKG